MRRALLIGSFIVLVAVLYGLWAFRFERLPSARTWSLADLRAGTPDIPGVEWVGDADNPVVRLRVSKEHPKIAMRLGIPGIDALRFVHLSFRMSSNEFKPGSKKWEDGRFMVEWHSIGGKEVLETDYAASIRNAQLGKLKSMVIDSESEAAVPALRVEHQGLGGEFELADLVITPVRERALWRVGKWFLAAAWLIWGFVWLRSWPGVLKWRALCASGFGLLMAISFIVPGPWDVANPLGGRFFLGRETRNFSMPDTERKSIVVQSAMVSPSGKLEDKGSLLLQIKIRISQVRLLLHALLWFAPTLVLVLLVGVRPAVWMALALALGMELAQPAFGFGSNWTDLLDLAFDAAGMALAVWVHARLLGGKFWLGTPTSSLAGER